MPDKLDLLVPSTSSVNADKLKEEDPLQGHDVVVDQDSDNAREHLPVVSGAFGLAKARTYPLAYQMIALEGQQLFIISSHLSRTNHFF